MQKAGARTQNTGATRGDIANVRPTLAHIAIPLAFGKSTHTHALITSPDMIFQFRGHAPTPPRSTDSPQRPFMLPDDHENLTAGIKKGAVAVTAGQPPDGRPQKFVP